MLALKEPFKRFLLQNVVDKKKPSFGIFKNAETSFVIIPITVFLQNPQASLHENGEEMCGWLRLSFNFGALSVSVPIFHRCFGVRVFVSCINPIPIVHVCLQCYGHDHTQDHNHHIFQQKNHVIKI